MQTIITASALQTAVKNASKMAEQGYTVTQDSVVPSFCIVNKNDENDTFYIVDTFAGFEKCDCPQAARAGYCKHIEFAKEFIADTQRANDFTEWDTFGKYL